MTRKFLTVFVALLFLLPILSFAQTRALLFPDGDLRTVDQEEAIKIVKVKGEVSDYKKQAIVNYLNANFSGTADTLKTRNIPGGTWNSNFGFNGQSLMIQWYVAPADLDVVAAGFAPSEPAAGEAPNNLQVKIVKMAWTEAEIRAITSDALYLGYYEATGNGKWDISAFMDNPDVTGDWVDAGNAATSPFGEDLWSDYGIGAPKQVTSDDVGTSGNPNYLWVDMDLLGFRPSVLQGEIFGVAVYNSGGAVGDNIRAGVFADNSLGVGSFKYYSDGRNTVGADGDWGWWARKYSWDIIAAVDLTGDRGPKIESMAALKTTLITAARTVDAVISDDNPSGGPAGVETAILSYSTDDGSTWSDVTMTGTEPNFSGDIPGQVAGTEILYFIDVTDVEGFSTQSPEIFYAIFAKNEEVLFVYNVGDFSQGTASWYYMGSRAGIPVGHDFWSTSSFGVVEVADVMAMYDNVIQVDGSFPSFDLTDEVDAWIQTGTSGAPKRYFLSSQDYGCVLDPACADITFEAGSFLYDYLGVSGITYQDFPAYTPSIQGDPWLVTPVMDDPISGFIAGYNADNSVLHYYDPAYETGLTNYMDNMDVVDAGNVTVTFTALDSAGAQQTVGVRNNGDGFYTAFISFDYFSTNWRGTLDSTQANDPDYAWGVAVFSQAAEFLNWAGFSSIDSDLGTSPHAYRLDQNYPNPFNPTTTIEYSIPNNTKVSLKIFDIQGREVVTLVDNNEKAGKHTVNFDASKFATGIYFYQLSTSDNQSLVKKMMFIK